MRRQFGLLAVVAFVCLVVGIQPAFAARLDVAATTAAQVQAAFGGQVAGPITGNDTGGTAFQVTDTVRVFQCTAAAGCGSAANGTYTYFYQVSYRVPALSTDTLSGFRFGSTVYDPTLNFGVMTGFSTGITGAVGDPTFNANGATWLTPAATGFDPGDTLTVYMQSIWGPGQIDFQARDTATPTSTSLGPTAGPVVPEPSSMLLVGSGMVLVGGFVRRRLAARKSAPATESV